MLADPKRIIAVGQHAPGADGALPGLPRRADARGKVIALKDTQVTLHEGRQAARVEAAIRGRRAAGTGWAQRPVPQPATPARETSRNDFRCGDKVAEDKYINTVVGTVVRINQRTATIDTGDGTGWRVGFGLPSRPDI